MFRKPKSKVNSRQRILVSDENAGGGMSNEDSEAAKKDDVDEQEQPVAKPPTSLLSFDHDEGADDNFEVKKSKKYLKEQKRQRRLEERAAAESRDDREREELHVRVKKEEPDDDDVQVTFKAPAVDKKAKNASLRTSTIKHERRSEEREMYESGAGPADSTVASTIAKFPTTLASIPDSRAVYEARKKREAMRRQGMTSGYIPLDDDQKLTAKGERHRLVREDDNDDSDEDSTNFYSSKTERKKEEARRRDAELDFVSQEQGDEDDELDEWERNQIEKAVSQRNIGELRYEHAETTRLNREYEERYGDNKTEVEMDVEVDDALIHGHVGAGGGANGATGRKVDVTYTAGSMEEVLARLKLRIEDREECMNTRRYEVNSMKNALEEKIDTMNKIRSSGPQLEEKYRMLQRVRVYSRCLLECLDEKVSVINELGDERRRVMRDRRERLEKRRRRDIKDCYEECAAVAAGKNLQSVRQGEHAMRASDREARRARRRREREGRLTGVSHQEGLSSDEDDTTSQILAHQHALQKVSDGVAGVFADTLVEYSSISAVLQRILEWLGTDEKSFTDSFVSLCLPKLSSPFVRLEFIIADVLGKDTVMHEMPWYLDALRAADHDATLGEHAVVVGFIPSILEKVVLPFLTDVVREEWEPLSLSQCTRLAFLLTTILQESPSIGERSRPLKRILEAIIANFNSRIDDDLFVPMFGRQALDNPQSGCRAFLDRQFWTAIKLLRCISAFSGVLSRHALCQLHYSVANRVCVLALQMVDASEPQVVVKVRALVSSMGESIPVGSIVQTRALLTTLKKCIQAHSAIKDFTKEMQPLVDTLEAIQAAGSA